jgi:uncharacterized protein YktB (UPF0637 family)
LITILGLSTLLQAQIRPQRVRVGENIAESLIAKMVQPIYPDEARSKSINGPLGMQVNISKSGDVEKRESAVRRPDSCAGSRRRRETVEVHPIG